MTDTEESNIKVFGIRKLLIAFLIGSGIHFTTYMFFGRATGPVGIFIMPFLSLFYTAKLFVFVILGVSDGVNEVIESFPVNSSNTQSRLTTGATLNTNSINIPASDLSILSTTNNAFINVLVSNVDYQEFSGKRTAFIKTFFYKRDRVVIQ